MTRIARVVGALAILLVVLVGFPVLLVTIGRLDALLPMSLERLTGGDDGSLLLGVLSSVAWVAWAVVALTIVFEAMAVLTSGRIRIRLPGTAWLRPSVAGLVVSLGALVAAAPLAGSASGAPHTVDPDHGSDSAHAGLVSGYEDESQLKGDIPLEKYTVAAGDDLWSLAERFLHSGTRWRAIAEANPWLDPTAQLEAGSVLRIPVQLPTSSAGDPHPAGASSDSASPEGLRADAVQQGSTVQVRRGDTLWAIAGRHLGDPQRWVEIYELNRDQIGDPDQIDVGWVLRLPSTSTTQLNGQAEDTGASSSASTPVPSEISPAQQPSRNTATANPDTGGEASTYDSPEPTVTQVSEVAEADWVIGIGGGLALGLLLLLGRQRLRQLLRRGLGRRVPAIGESERRFARALEQCSAELPPPAGAASTTVVLGWDADEAVTVDLEKTAVLSLLGETDRTTAVLAAVSSSLLCADWCGDVNQIVVGRHECWGVELLDPSVTELQADDGLPRLRQLIAARRMALDDGDLDLFRADPDLAPLWEPTVFLFCCDLSAAERAEIATLCSSPVGVSAVICGDGGVELVIGRESAEFQGRRFEVQEISAPARRALVQLFRTAASDETSVAPWWSDDDLPPNVTPLHPCGEREEFSMDLMVQTARDHPTLLMLGTVELVGATGEMPLRATKQCLEYCAWLLARPGCTGSVMAAELIVAEPTRRSNLSRLRTWLGRGADGTPYLPEAYSGRIQLHADVTSDWEEFCLLTAGGVNRVGPQALRRALELVRGAPLADAAPWQWQWADELRADMVSAIRDAAVILAEHAVKMGDNDLARWAVERGLSASFDDELLLALSAVIAHRSGDVDESRRVVMGLMRRVRVSGVDLQERTVSLLQQVIEGRERVRRL